MEPLTILGGAALVLFLLSSKSSPKKPAAGGGGTKPSSYQPPGPGGSSQPKPAPTKAYYYLYSPGGTAKNLGLAEAPAMDGAMKGLAVNLSNTNVLMGKGSADGVYSLDRFWDGNATDRTNVWSQTITYKGLGGGGKVTASYSLKGPNGYSKDLGSAEDTPAMDASMKGLAGVLVNTNVMAGQGSNDGEYELDKNGKLIWVTSGNYASM